MILAFLRTKDGGNSNPDADIGVLFRDVYEGKGGRRLRIVMLVADMYTSRGSDLEKILV